MWRSEGLQFGLVKPPEKQYVPDSDHEFALAA